jgi:chemotaxis protein MotA
MDLATIIGLVGGILVVFLSIITAGTLGAFIDIPSIMVVGGGTLMVTLIRFPLPVVINTLKVVGKAFSSKVSPVEQIIEEIVNLAETARKESILALEKVDIENEFLSKGVRMSVDGKDPETIRSIMQTELDFLRERHSQGKSVLDAVGDAAPAMGMIGTLIGLVIMLGSLEDPSSIGPAMAVALLTTFYGSMIANLFAIPLATKLGVRSEEECLNMDIMIAGVLSILSGDNLRVIKDKLQSFLAPKMRTASEE